MRFTSRTVLITGGGSGIGRVMAQHFAAEGAAVVIADRFSDRAEKVAEEIATARGKALATQADVSVSSDVDAMVDAAEKAFGNVGILVNNAAVCEADNLASMKESLWDVDLAVNLKSVFLCSKRVLPGMMERR